MAGNTEFDRKKFDALVFYLKHKVGKMTRAKLCCLLYYCDFGAYGKLGKSITGATYTKGRKYPIPCDANKTPLV